MDDKNKITRNDAVFYLDMIGSSLSPNYSRNLGEVKPYYKILDEKNSDDFKRFLWIYTEMRDFLSEREQIILNEIYGVNKERAKLKAVAEMMNVSPERVRQIGKEAEFKIARKISAKLKDVTNLKGTF